MPPRASDLHPSVVLVADRTLSARYPTLFEGIFATMQTTQVPAIVMRSFVSPRARADGDGRALIAPLGLRRIEAALLAGAAGKEDTAGPGDAAGTSLAAPLPPEEVACATPESLPRLLGPWTKIVAVSSSDPMGIGMTNTTTTQFWKGRLYTAVWMERLMARVRAGKDRHGFTVVGGGGGAWQWVQNPSVAREQGFDVIFDGYFENKGPALFAELLAGRQPAELVREDGTAIRGLKPIRSPSVFGAIELSRGCGKGCRFCTSARRPMEHVPQDAILSDIHTNVAAGVRSVVFGSEDFFRYGASGPKVQFEKLRSLLEAMRQVVGVSFVQIDHANVSSVVQYEDEQLREVHRLLQRERRTDFLWVNMGIESANGRLVAANSPGKVAPFRADDWEDMVRQAADKMVRTGFFPVFSVILGLPGETLDDVRRTLKLVQDLARQRVVVFPIFHEPVLPEARAAGQAFGLQDMTLDHLDLYVACYEINFKWVPKLFWDNQRAGGVGLVKRLMVQALGKVEMRSWRQNFARVRRQILSRPA